MTKKLTVIRRNGTLIDFDESRIQNAMRKAFVACEFDNAEIEKVLPALTSQVCSALQADERLKIPIAKIQEEVEFVLMETYPEVARQYIEYRSGRDVIRKTEGRDEPILTYLTADGRRVNLNNETLTDYLKPLLAGLAVSSERIVNETLQNLFTDIPEQELSSLLEKNASTFSTVHPDYEYAAARIVLNDLYQSVLGINYHSHSAVEIEKKYQRCFDTFITQGIAHKLLDRRLGDFDTEKLANALCVSRDNQFRYLGITTLKDRYFLSTFNHTPNKKIIELPQYFFMRVAMGLALNEIDREDKAIEFYNVLSTFKLMCSTPTLFNSGTPSSQLSSCYISAVHDSTEGITQTIADNARLSKFAGGIGNDWTMVRATGSHIASTNGKSGGVIPFMKMAESTLQAFNQGGKRKGTGCAYLEIWHLDIDEFLDLRKNTGDERRRTHDMDTAVWVPDLFMFRVERKQSWTLFSPDDCYTESGEHIHELFGADFEKAYLDLEKKTETGEITLFKKVDAGTLYRLIISRLFETGHPWICFKDSVNYGNTQAHIGAVLSSNLCTEITEVSKAGNPHTGEGRETAVCNLASINLEKHIVDGKLQVTLLENTVTTAMRMLDNVIDVNFYPVPSAQASNYRHRPVGLGLMGFQNALFELGIMYGSKLAVQMAEDVQEYISYFAISASHALSIERGSYPSFDGSSWSQGVLPIDLFHNGMVARGLRRDSEFKQYTKAKTQFNSPCDWDSLRIKVKTGMRNSNCMAIAPTATIANIVGTSQSIEPSFENIATKSNLSGEFKSINRYLVRALEKAGLWTESMSRELITHAGSVQQLNIPDSIKRLFKTGFELDYRWLIHCAAARQQFIDQSQSFNIMFDSQQSQRLYNRKSGASLEMLYTMAWHEGLKTTYYLRAKAATSVKPAEYPVANVLTTTTNYPVCESCQ